MGRWITRCSCDSGVPRRPPVGRRAQSWRATSPPLLIVILGWFAAPEIIFAGFILLTWAHWGLADLWWSWRRGARLFHLPMAPGGVIVVARRAADIDPAGRGPRVVPPDGRGRLQSVPAPPRRFPLARTQCRPSRGARRRRRTGHGRFPPGPARGRHPLAEPGGGSRAAGILRRAPGAGIGRVLFRVLARITPHPAADGRRKAPPGDNSRGVRRRPRWARS